MKTPALRRFREKLAADEPVFGLWVTLESASITEMAVALGLDWVVIDVEHGHLDWHDVLEHVRATVRSDTVILVRIVGLDQGVVKRALDIGADGVLVPWVETAEQLRDALASAQYPLAGVRGIGGERATCWGQCLPQHVQEANENVLVIPIIESVTGMMNLGEMLRVPGVDVFFFGPSDYSSSAGFAGQWEGPGVAEQILAAKDRIRTAGRSCGVIATGVENLRQRVEQGFRMLAVGLDGGLLIGGLRAALASVGRDRSIVPTLIPGGSPTRAAGAAAGYGGGAGAVTDVSTAAVAPRAGEMLAPGVMFQPHSGLDGAAAELTAGLVTFERGAKLPYHRHAFCESITLLAGEAVVEVEGRMYTLRPLETVMVPAGLAHAAMNRSATEPARFHIAMGSGRPARELVDTFFPRKGMPHGTTGEPGVERVIRFPGVAGRER